MTGSAASIPGFSGKPQRPRRARELQDPLNHYLYHPLAWNLARALAHTPITPNMVSVCGALLVMLAGIAYAQPFPPLIYPLSAGVGMLLHMSWHVVDGADGDLARITGRSSPFGEMIDGICDYASHVVLYCILAVVLTAQIGALPAWVLVLIAGASHVFQANHVEAQRRSYQWWVYGTPWLAHTRRNSESAAIKGWKAALTDSYLALASKLNAGGTAVDTVVEAAKGDSARRARIGEDVRAEWRHLWWIERILGPNPRAIVLGLSMFAGSPAWYFLYQSLVLNGLLVLSIMLHNRAARRIADRNG